jgi:DNA-directed RNA polymerase beta' subunit
MVKDRAPAAKILLEREVKERPVMFNRAPTLHRYSILGAYPKLVPGKTIRINPFVETPLGADYDGDTMMIHAPVHPKAVEEVKNMTMSKILYGDATRNELYATPAFESLMGIAHASSEDKKNKPVTFATKADAAKAYREGKITLGTRVVIKEQ